MRKWTAAASGSQAPMIDVVSVKPMREVMHVLAAVTVMASFCFAVSFI